jgi:DNA-binding NtrC family response regulator
MFLYFGNLQKGEFFSQNWKHFLFGSVINKNKNQNSMDAFKIFVVEDDPFYGELLKRHLSLNPDNQVFLFKTGKECLKNMHLNPDFVSLDYRLPDISGLEVMKKIKMLNPEIPIVIVSGQEDVETAIDLLKAGAYDYFTKTSDTKDRLWNSVNKVRQNKALKTELDELKEEISQKYNFEKSIIGKSDSIKNIYKLIEKATKTNITVSITGETGTGKELVAKAIHYNSPRAKKPFVAINVSAVPNELIESELFGYEKGAFTGANTRKTGKFEQADGGTLFLDEIGEMNINMQAKLLRVLQERELTRIGGNKIIPVTARIIVATHKDLSEEVKKGNFREDLYYRLLGLPIELPPLRFRGNDILILAKHFIRQFAKENKMKPKELTKAAGNKLMKYPYPGNVRELRAIIELAMVMSDDDFIDEQHIIFNTSNAISEFLLEENTLADYEKKIIRYYLNKFNGNVIQTAKKLDIGKSTIYRMLKNKEI